VEVETEEEGEQLGTGKRRRWRWRWRWWGRKVGGRSEAGMVVEKEIGESERWRRGRGRKSGLSRFCDFSLGFCPRTTGLVRPLNITPATKHFFEYIYLFFTFFDPYYLMLK
jgi:hypothetical protein